MVVAIHENGVKNGERWQVLEQMGGVRRYRA